MVGVYRLSRWWALSLLNPVRGTCWARPRQKWNMLRNATIVPWLALHSNKKQRSGTQCDHPSPGKRASRRFQPGFNSNGSMRVRDILHPLQRKCRGPFAFLPPSPWCKPIHWSSPASKTSHETHKTLLASTAVTHDLWKWLFAEKSLIALSSSQLEELCMDSTSLVVKL